MSAPWGGERHGDFVHAGRRIPRLQTTNEIVQRAGASFDFQLDSPVVTVAHPSGQRQRISEFFGVPTETDALDLSTNDDT